jgi:hypothetical protein
VKYNLNYAIVFSVFLGQLYRQKIAQELMPHFKNSLFISMCISRDLPQGHYVGGAPPILYIPLFPLKYFFFMKQKKKKKKRKQKKFV